MFPFYHGLLFYFYASSLLLFLALFTSFTSFPLSLFLSLNSIYLFRLPSFDFFSFSCSDLTSLSSFLLLFLFFLLSCSLVFLFLLLLIYFFQSFTLLSLFTFLSFQLLFLLLYRLDFSWYTFTLYAALCYLMLYASFHASIFLFPSSPFVGFLFVIYVFHYSL